MVHGQHDYFWVRDMLLQHDKITPFQLRNCDQQHIFSISFVLQWLRLANAFNTTSAAMAFHKKEELIQQEQEELHRKRPVIIYVHYCTHSFIQTLHTTEAIPEPELPVGIILTCVKDEGNPYVQLCQFASLLVAALDACKGAAYRVLVINAHQQLSSCDTKN